MSDPILFNLMLAAAIVFGLVYTIWVVHLIVDDASIIDMIWGLGFGLVTLALLMTTQPKTNYNVLLATLPIIWSVRFTTFITLRNWGHGEDDRYTSLRQRIKIKGVWWPLFSFFGVYGFQAAVMLIVALPIIVGMAAPESTSLNWLSVVGTVVWLIGFLFEAIGDLQLYVFRRANQNYDGLYEKKPVLDRGLWSYSRHPNYFGNACIWWGIGLIALQAPWGWLALIGPALMNYALLYLTGKANNERKMNQRPAYRGYVERTSGFFPWPPSS